MVVSAVLIERVVENFMLLADARAKRRGERVDVMFARDADVIEWF